VKTTLLLNNDYTPLNFVSSIRAFNLVANGRAELIVLEKPSIWDEPLTSASRNYAMPATIKMKSYVHKRWFIPRFRNYVIFNRDNWQCQYCNISLTLDTISIDHITPECKGGDTTWRNCITSCKKCNNRKGAKTLSEAGMKIISFPSDPKIYHFWDSRKNGKLSWHSDWNGFF